MALRAIFRRREAGDVREARMQLPRRHLPGWVSAPARLLIRYLNTINVAIDVCEFAAPSSIEQVLHLCDCLGDELGHDCVLEAALHTGATRLNLSKDNRHCISDSPASNGVADVRLDNLGTMNVDSGHTSS